MGGISGSHEANTVCTFSTIDRITPGGRARCPVPHPLCGNEEKAMNCKFCNKPVILSPSAEERARKCVTGHSAAYYRNLFRYHADCWLEIRDGKTKEKDHAKV